MEVPRKEFPYHFRLPATIVMAESARQIGRRAAPALGRPRRHEPPYEYAVKVLVEEAGQVLYLEELSGY